MRRARTALHQEGDDHGQGLRLDQGDQGLQALALEDGRVAEDRLLPVRRGSPDRPLIEDYDEEFDGPREGEGTLMRRQEEPSAASYQTPNGRAPQATTMAMRNQMEERVHPAGQPVALRPQLPRLPPLFDSQQLDRLERLQQSAPQLYRQVSEERPSRLAVLGEEELRLRQQHLESETLQEVRNYMAMRQEEQVEMWKMLRELRQENAVLRRNNQMLLERVNELEKEKMLMEHDPQFETPEDAPGDKIHECEPEERAEAAASPSQRQVMRRSFLTEKDRVRLKILIKLR